MVSKESSISVLRAWIDQGTPKLGHKVDIELVRVCAHGDDAHGDDDAQDDDDAYGHMKCYQVFNIPHVDFRLKCELV